VRTRLTANTTFYVRTDGNDLNTGLINSAAGAFLTLQAAVNRIATTVDLAGFQALVKVGSGTFTVTGAPGVTLNCPLVGANPTPIDYPNPDTAPILIQGDATTPANVTLTCDSAVGTVLATDYSYLAIEGFTLLNTGNGPLLYAADALILHGAMVFGACGTGTKILSGHFGLVESYADFHITGACGAVLQTFYHGSIYEAAHTMTVDADFTCATAFAIADRLSELTCTQTITNAHTVTGKLFVVTNNSIITVGGNGINYFPGTIAGTCTPGSSYDGLQLGVTDGSNAAAGCIGEYISSDVPVGSEVAITNGTIANITSISLTAGDWDLSGTVVCDMGPTTTSTAFYAFIHTVSTTLPTALENAGALQGWVGSTTGSNPAVTTGVRRLSLSVTTTVYLEAFPVITAPSHAYGFLGARRVR
jgi:hypothetical protein